MLKLISINSDGVAWVETDCGKVFGIVNAFEMLDCDGGIIDNQDIIDVLAEYTDFDLVWEYESNCITFSDGQSMLVSDSGLELATKA
jgi:hypothetical protein